MNTEDLKAIYQEGLNDGYRKAEDEIERLKVLIKLIWEYGNGGKSGMIPSEESWKQFCEKNKL